VRHALEVDGDGISEVLGNRGGVDSEQGVEAKMMARQGPREFPAATVDVTRGSGRIGEVVGTGNFIGYRGKEGLRIYQGLEGDEASSVAKFLGSRWSEIVGIPHRSSACRRIDPVEDECIGLGQTGTNEDVREVRFFMRSQGILITGIALTLSHWNRQRTATNVRSSDELIQLFSGLV
jgi:hypothetical protein